MHTPGIRIHILINITYLNQNISYRVLCYMYIYKCVYINDTCCQITLLLRRWVESRRWNLINNCKQRLAEGMSLIQFQSISYNFRDGNVEHHFIRATTRFHTSFDGQLALAPHVDPSSTCTWPPTSSLSTLRDERYLRLTKILQ